MAERLDIVVEERGSRVVSRNINDVGNSAKSAGGSVDLLRRGLQLLGGALAIRAIVGFADSFTQLQNQIRVASGETNDLVATTQRLFEISNKTRTSIEANVQLFQRLSFAAGELGATQEQLFTFVETTGRALAIQGGSASAASGALLQLSQAIGSGIVRAEEFNSILEGAFPIALAVAAGLDKAGGSVSKLRNLIIQGQVTSKEFFDALLSQSDALEAAFARTTPTISQAFTVLRNNAIQFFGELDKGTGVTALISQSILKLALNLDRVGKIALVVGTAMATAFAPSLVALIGRATAAAAGFVLALGPIGIAATALVALAVAAQELTGGLFELEGVTVTLGDVITTTFGVAKSLFETTASVVTQTLAPAFGLVGQEIGSLRDVLAATFNFFVRTLDTLIGVAVGFGRAIGAAIRIGLTDLPAAIEGAFIAGFNGAVTAAEATANFIFGILRKLGVDIADVTFEPLKLEGSAAGREAADAISTAFSSGLDVRPVEALVGLIGDEALAVARLRIEQGKATKATVADNVAKAKAIELTTAQASAFATLRDRLDPLGALTRQQTKDQELLNLALKAGAVSAAEYERLQAGLNRQFDEAGGNLVQKYNLQTQEQLDLLQSIQGPAKSYAQTQEDLNFLLKQGAVSQAEFNRALTDARINFLDTQQDAASGAERAFLKIGRDAADFASQTESLIVGAFNSAQDALVEFAQTGKFEFGDLIRSISADLIRLGTNEAFTALTGGGGSGGGGLGALVTGALSGGGGGGGGDGGIFGGIGSLFGFANGGGFTVGDSTSVASLPGLDNRVVAFKARDGEEVNITPRDSAGGGGRPMSVNFNFPSGTNVESFRRSEGQVAARISSMLARANTRNN
jgi:tape measure domain-containing protein